MPFDIGPRIGIEGEREYKKAISEIAAGQKVLRSELELVSAKFSGQENSIESLTARHDVLQRTLYGEQEKVEALKNALQNAATSYGESDKRTMAWQEKLNKAETELVKTEQELKKTEKAMDGLSDAEGTAAKQSVKFGEAQKDAGKSLKGLGDAVNDLGSKFGIHLPQGMQNAMNNMGQLDLKTVAFVGTAGAMVAALIKIEKQLISMTKESAKYADNIMELSTITGISTQRLQEYTYAAELLDVSVETITGSQTKLIKSMQAASDGTGAQAEAFNKLNVSITDSNGQLKNTDEVFWQVITALGQMTNDTERDAVAMDILGKSARDLNPLIKAGAGSMEELAKEAHKAGYVLDTDALEALGAVDDAMQRLDKTTEGAKNQLAAQFAPSLATVTNQATDFVRKTSNTFRDTHLVETFGGLLEAVTGLLDPLSALIEWGAPGLSAAFKVIASSIAIVADTLNAIVGMLQILSIVNFREGVKRLNTAMGWRESYGDLSYQQQIARADALKTNVWDPELKAWVGNGPGNASGNVNWRGGYTWVGENGPELAYLPAGTQIKNAQESALAGTTNIYVTIDAKNVREFNDIVQIAQTARMRSRKG